jgi:hypothetical protein
MNEVFSYALRNPELDFLLSARTFPKYLHLYSMAIQLYYS